MALDHRTEPRSPGHGGGWILLAACGGFFLASLLLLLLPIGYLGVVFVLGGLVFSVVSLLHYLVWGVWMTRLLRAQDAQPTSKNDEVEATEKLVGDHTNRPT